ncbi:TatD family hydrolase [Clostridium sp. Sa3CVN1]|uniref:TatD family hydrolase n=1 Tax=Clostridium cibarium TaxID=2762247 RepID=A0ABR8PUW7_9CLOT|nr:TatD family hydrolase [Clostridium cibarium]
MRFRVIKQIPIENLLIESDRSFTKINGKRYTFDKLSRVYTLFGELLNINLEKTNTKIAQNFVRLFEK